MSDVPVNRFVWHDLMTLDRQADLAFYQALAGWKAVDEDMGELGDYTVISADDVGQGGVVDLPSEASGPSHWLGYVSVPDIAAALESASAHSATIQVPATTAPGVGTWAVLEDPGGAAIAPIQGEGELAPQGQPSTGWFVWWELVTSDIERAQAFYGDLFGWEAQEIDMGGMPYWLWGMKGADQGGNIGGLMTMPGGYDGPDFWMYYLLVPDVDAAAAQVEALGGKLIAQPEAVPGQGRMCVVNAPSGAQLALFTHNSEA